MNSKYMYQEVKTNIIGLDRLLLNRLEIPKDGNVTIVIRGDEIMDRTCFGLQLLYGLGQSYDLLHEKHDAEPVSLRFVSACMSKPYLDDLLLDMLITTGVRYLTRRYVGSYMKHDQLNRFASAWFDMKEVLCLKHTEAINSLPLREIRNETDLLISEEAIYYSLRTNALHFRTGNKRSDDMNILYPRRYDCIHDYFENVGPLMKLLGRDLCYPLLDVDIQTGVCPNSYVDIYPDEVNLVGVDLTSLYECCEDEESAYCALLSTLRHYKNVPGRGVFIIIVPGKARLPECPVDVLIDMKTTMRSGYQLQYLSIVSNKLQQSKIGWHQYKRLDRTIEVYPSLHTYFSERQYLQRALVYTHSNVISDTFQQYLNNNAMIGNSNASYIDYQNTREQVSDRYYEDLYPHDSYDFSLVDILERILLSESSTHRRSKDLCETDGGPDMGSNVVRGYRGGVTAVIGHAHTYKRFLTFGGIFSAALNREHTLLLLLNKDDAMIRRRLSCPARRSREVGCKDCKSCYSYIHFMNICMGNITPDEFIYQLERQIEVAFACGKKIKRIVVDEMQIIDYCFPLLSESPLFIAALVAFCRDRGISLYMLCDKRGRSVGTLRAVADNIICTDRDKDGKSLLYIDRFAGYNNIPSKVYCARICKVRDLFECYTRLNDNEERQSFYTLKGNVIEDQSRTSTNDFWKDV